MTTPRDGGGKGEGGVAGAQQLELWAGIGTEDLGKPQPLLAMLPKAGCGQELFWLLPSKNSFHLHLVYFIDQT